MVVKNVQVRVLLENTKNSSNPSLEAKHGMSFLVTATMDKDKKTTILMDTGPSPDALLNNVKALGVDLNDVDTVVLSHGHYDHTGGLIEALKHIEKRVLVIGHPLIFDPKLKVTPSLSSIGAPFNRSKLESAGGLPILATNPVKIADGITTTGEVPRTTEFERVRGFWTVNNVSFKKDLMIDDQSLVVDVEGKGLVVISGCAHSGIINTIKYAQQITQNQTVYAVLGGFHLISSNDETIQTTVDSLKSFDPKIVAPCHCTGKNAIKKIQEAFTEQYRSICIGDIVEL
jgi:7,8-dihydropterin-6-yl-methyl-4-(beta-D-ribofuranosyl)aminobenzene 5'-phosphate synthase